MHRTLISAIVVLFSSCESKVKISDSPEILRAIYDTGFSGAYFSFKQDSTFEWFSGSALGSSDTYQGRYLLQDSLIILDKVGFASSVKSTRLLIENDSSDTLGSTLYKWMILIVVWIVFWFLKSY